MARRSAPETFRFSPLTPARRRRRRRRPGRTLALVLVLAAAVALALWWLPAWAGKDDERERSQGATARGLRVAAAAAASPLEQARAARRPDAPLTRAHPLLVDARSSPPRRLRSPVRARGAILVDARDGRVLWARYPHRRLPIASTTKIMTALLAIERLRPHQVVTVAPAAARAAPIREGLRPRERVKVWKLLYGLMLYSGNDDALALAVASAGRRERFLDLMNARARELGLRNTHFTTPSGVIDRQNYSTAWDLAALTRFALREPLFRKVVRTRIKHVRWAAPTHSKIYVNKNSLLGSYRGANGVKTGWTTLAGQCLVASATRRGVRLIAVVLGSPDAGREARRLLDLGFRSAG